MKTEGMQCKMQKDILLGDFVIETGRRDESDVIRNLKGYMEADKRSRRTERELL